MPTVGSVNVDDARPCPETEPYGQVIGGGFAVEMHAVGVFDLLADDHDRYAGTLEEFDVTRYRTAGDEYDSVDLALQERAHGGGLGEGVVAHIGDGGARATGVEVLLEA